MNYIDLRTDYSFMRGYMLPKAAVARAQVLGAGYIGLADYCSTWGHIPFGKAAFKAGLKFVPGVTLPVVAELDKRPLHSVAAIYPITGEHLGDLYKLVGLSAGQTHYRPRVTWQQLADGPFTVIAYRVLEEHVDGLLAISESQRFVALRKAPGDWMQQAARAHELPVALAPQPCMAVAADRQGLDLVRRASELTRIGETLNQIEPIHMARPGELLQLLGVDQALLDRAVENTNGIAARSAIERFPRAQLPKAPAGWSLRAAAEAGAATRGISLAEGSPYGQRLDRELEVIEAKGFADYFYFVGEICQWARGVMLVGPGRGSAGGCLVAYLLGITEVDPLVHGTLFERFIDPTRNDMPDIDVDFADDRRDMVFGKLRELYGEAHVARIGTVSELGGKSAVNEVARIERDIPWTDKRALASCIPDGIDAPPLQFIFEHDDTAAKLIEQHPPLAAAVLLEGRVRHHGVHAAGVCVSAQPASDFGAVKDGVISLTLDDAETVGLLKFDALGLTTLSVVAEACMEAGIDPYDLNKLPLDDPRVYTEVFQRDRMVGIFQAEGQTVRGLMREIECDRFSDLPALASLARPGPLNGGAAAAWVRRREGLVDWEYEHPLLEPITKSTYGLIVYQEQMMGIGREIAGFDVGQVNRMRKAVGKKDPVALAAMQGEFMAGAVKTVGEKIARSLWDQICDFGAYAFNLSHAVAYSLLTYQCAWLKCYHPQAFAIGLLRHCGDDERAKIILRELLIEGGLQFCPFDPEKSELTWAVKDGVLYGGFLGLIGVGLKTANKFVTLRAANPQGWIGELTLAQRAKLSEHNTPWTSMDAIGKWFGDYFTNPESKNVNGPVYRIADIPHRKGSYVAIAKLSKVMVKDQNDPERVAKRGGRRVTGPTRFLNLIFADDGVEIGATINRYKWEEMGQPIEHDKTNVGAYFLIRGEILGGDGPKWLMLDKLRRLEVPSGSQEQDNN